MDKDTFYKWFKANQKLFKIYNVEKLCEIPQGSLNRNLKLDLEDFKHSDKLLKLYQTINNSNDEKSI